VAIPIQITSYKSLEITDLMQSLNTNGNSREEPGPCSQNKEDPIDGISPECKDPEEEESSEKKIYHRLPPNPRHQDMSYSLPK
jgi:hypothetical protein